MHEDLLLEQRKMFVDRIQLVIDVQVGGVRGQLRRFDFFLSELLEMDLTFTVTKFTGNT